VYLVQYFCPFRQTALDDVFCDKSEQKRQPTDIDAPPPASAQHAFKEQNTCCRLNLALDGVALRNSSQQANRAAHKLFKSIKQLTVI